MRSGKALRHLAELPRDQTAQHSLVLLFHHPAHQLFEIALASTGGIARLLGGDDISAEEKMGDEVGVRQTGVLGLDVIDPLAVLDVVVESDDGGGAARAHRDSQSRRKGPPRGLPGVNRTVLTSPVFQTDVISTVFV